MKIFFFYVSFLLFWESHSIYCPHYCRCGVTNNWKHVACIGKTIVSVDLDIPKLVQWLQLSNNSIYEIPNLQFWNLQLVSLVEIDLSHNQIQQIGLDAFSGLNKLKKVDLSFNHLYHIFPNTFETNRHLEVLSLRGNPLRYMIQTEEFLVSKSLSVLDISHCRLNYFHGAAFRSLPKLKVLNVSSTGISHISEPVLTTLEKLDILDISRTGFRCDESVKSVLNWALNKTKVIGSPCVVQKVEKKFEKMTVFEVPIGGEFDETSDECICECEEKNENLEIPNLPNLPMKAKVKKFSLGTTEYLIAFAFVSGLIVGGAVAAAVILTWIYCCKLAFSRRQRRNLGRNIYIHCETPPPSYNDLFY